MDLKESAMAYTPKTTKNVADMEVVLLTYPIAEREGVDKEGKTYKYKVILFKEDEYRVPESVLSDIKTLLSVKPSMKSVKVTKKGQGLNTSYSVIPIE